MYSQLSLSAAKLEISDHQRRAERQLSCDRPAKSRRRLRASSLARLVRLQHAAPAAARAGGDAA